ncbi:MAG: class I SAM-dependent methyltransferase [Candidatus Electrothrix sp. GM3_4]|nr:class I SAM-dependent methyltransferase [Candidatus Electrothrix sp. GM3_4]
MDYRVANVEKIARSMLQVVAFNPSMDIMDFGSGTGLLLEKIAPFVHSISAVDISQSMHEQLEKKRHRLGCELEIMKMDLSKSVIDRKYDGIISSMTMHHVEDIALMFSRFYSMLNNNGFITIADLYTEQGDFHTENIGVFHFGFDHQKLIDIAGNAGFGYAKTIPASTVHKPQGDFPVFLLTATK